MMETDKFIYEQHFPCQSHGLGFIKRLHAAFFSRDDTLLEFCKPTLDSKMHQYRSYQRSDLPGKVVMGF